MTYCKRPGFLQPRQEESANIDPIDNFPQLGQQGVLEWDQAAQRFEIVGIIAVPEE